MPYCCLLLHLLDSVRFDCLPNDLELEQNKHLEIVGRAIFHQLQHVQRFRHLVLLAYQHVLYLLTHILRIRPCGGSYRPYI